MNDYNPPDPNVRFELWLPKGCDIEAHWAALEALEPAAQLAATCTRIGHLDGPPERYPTYGAHWRAVLPHLPLAEDLKRRFWVEFSKPDCVKNRKEALWGLAKARRESLIPILEDAQLAMKEFNRVLHTDGHSNVKRYLEAQDALRVAFAELGQWFAEKVETRDFKALEMIAAILKKGEKTDADVKGGLDSNDGKILFIFNELHVKGRTLPGKNKMLEEYAILQNNPLAQSASDQRQAFSKQVDKSLKKLGLSSLPP